MLAPSEQIAESGAAIFVVRTSAVGRTRPESGVEGKLQRRRPPWVDALASAGSARDWRVAATDGSSACVRVYSSVWYRLHVADCAEELEGRHDVR